MGLRGRKRVEAELSMSAWRTVTERCPPRARSRAAGLGAQAPDGIAVLAQALSVYRRHFGALVFTARSAGPPT